jgi:hypothetical protein
VLATAIVIAWITDSFYTGLAVAAVLYVVLFIGSNLFVGWLKWRIAKRFAAPQGLVVTTRQVMEQGWPILLVTHDDVEPRGWQFVNGHGDTDDPADGIPIHVQHVVDRDFSVRAVVNLPPGWRAWRSSEDEPWSRAADAE